MTPPKTPEELELDELLEELAHSDEERAQLLEEHRQLEKDLLRLADPLPPADFVHKVMVKVSTAPARAPAKGEVLMAVAIVGAALAVSVFAFGIHNEAGNIGTIGLTFTRLFLQLRDTVVGIGSGLAAIWRTAPLAFTAALSVALAATLVALKRVLPQNSLTEAKVVS